MCFIGATFHKGSKTQNVKTDECQNGLKDTECQNGRVSKRTSVKTDECQNGRVSKRTQSYHDESVTRPWRAWRHVIKIHISDKNSILGSSDILFYRDDTMTTTWRTWRHVIKIHISDKNSILGSSDNNSTHLYTGAKTDQVSKRTSVKTDSKTQGVKTDSKTQNVKTDECQNGLKATMTRVWRGRDEHDTASVLIRTK